MKSIVKLGALLGCGFVLVGCSNNTPLTTKSVTEATTVNPVKRYRFANYRIQST